VTNLFLATEPLRGRRSVMVSDQRTRLDFARWVKALVEVPYPEAETIVLVLDQLTTHTPAALAATSPPTEAKRLTDNLEIHDTPTHGNWFNMAELELSVLQRQCLAARIPDRVAMEHAGTAWADRRNAATRRIDGQFTTTDARSKLHRLYPAFAE